MRKEFKVIYKALFMILIAYIAYIYISKFNNVNAASTLTNTTRAYFYSEIGSGDCILLENYDKNGNKKYGLIDAGIYKDSNGNAVTSVKKFLNNHKVTELEFLFITHNHTDHNGDALEVLDNFSVKTIYMNSFDINYVTDQNSQKIYESIIERAINKNIKVVGVGYQALKSSKISPGRSNDFIKNTQNAKQSNFIEFNTSNTKFIFGSSQIQIFNWEVFDKNGNQLYIKQSSNDVWEYQTINGVSSSREIVENDNNNSLGLLLTQGNKKAFFAGDINNVDKNDTTGRIGDEDRIKDKIGDIDLLKLGHHGNTESNTLNYMNVLKPEYAIITNNLGKASKEISDWMEEKNVDYLYSTQDSYEVSATLTQTSIYLGLGTEKVINKINNKLYYIPEGSKYTNYKENLYKVTYKEKNVNASSWEQLKTAIKNNTNNYYNINNTNKTYTLYELVANLTNGGDWTANSTINIEKNQKITLTSSENITILRGTSIKGAPLFLIKGNLSLGKENMNGEIILDGNKTKVTSTCALVHIQYGDLNIYNKIKLCNNFNKTTEMTLQTGVTNYYVPFGSGIYSMNGNINIYGGEITNNSQKVEYDLELPEETIRYYELSTMGAGIYMESNSVLNMYGGIISRNFASNNSVVKTKNTYTNAKTNKGIKQRCLGVGIFANRNSKLNLVKGEIKQNGAINNSSIQLITPSTTGKITNIYSLNNSIYGVGIYADSSNMNISNGFKLSNNNATQNSQILLQNNTKIKGSAVSSIRGLNVYVETSNVDINGAEIIGGTCISNSNITNYGSIGNNGAGSVSTINLGGGISINNCLKSNIKNVNINNCNCDRGGAIYINLSDVLISNSNINNNKAIYGGGIFVANNESNVKIINSRITNNSAINESGGGIYAYGTLEIEGEDTEILNNTAYKTGGGIKLVLKGIINGGKISGNTASNGAGGGIYADNATLIINKGTIEKNIAQTTGGGINYTNGNLTRNGGDIRNNIAKKDGNNIFPKNNSILDETEPKIETILKGDVNKNGEIDISDILQLERHIAYINGENTASKHPEWKLNSEKLSIGDLNENGIIDIVDILKLLRYMSAINNKETAKKHADWLILN